MRKRFGSALRIGLSKTDVTVVHTRGWLRTRSEIIGEWSDQEEEHASPEVVATKLGALLKEVDCSRLPARIVLSDACVRRWMVTPPQNATRLADCRAAANARFQVLFGEPMSDWQFAADWDARQPFLACAAPRLLLTALQQVARDHGLILLEVAPQFVVAWNRWRADLQVGAWFGVLQRKVLTFAVLGRNGPEATREVVLPDEVMLDQQHVPEILAREALRLNVPMPSEIRLCGQIPAHWVMQKIGNMTFVRLDRLRIANMALSPGMSLALTGMPS
ncbi:MAG: hypothetical protein WB870_02155 [Gallionellaceae bacterium]